ncbi:MAG TPA: zinc metallopeptidase [Candidatus Hydrogenedens sp.]|nr:zinc metallopeptidase [Candidatus Hydrogenedens sp.]
MPIYFFHPADLLIIPAVIFAIWAQMRVKYAYSKYATVPTKRGITGLQVAQWILERENINDVDVEITEGELTDHYDPKAKKVRLSQQVYYGHSIASVGIAAHELGHVIQHAHSYAPMQVRNFIYPACALGSNLAFPLIILGFILSSVGVYANWLINVGIYMFSLAVLFTVITLPVEFNASRRAIKILADGSLMEQDELKGVRAVLSAAALTYVAAATAAILQLIRLLIITRGRE